MANATVTVSVTDLSEVKWRLQQLSDAREKYLKLYAALAQHEPRINMETGGMALDVYLCITKDYDGGGQHNEISQATDFN